MKPSFFHFGRPSCSEIPKGEAVMFRAKNSPLTREAKVSVSFVPRFVVPFKSFWLHETACVELMMKEANDRFATL